VAVVGATERLGTYGNETLRNLFRFGFEGDVWPVNPGRSLAPTTAIEAGRRSRVRSILGPY